MARPLKYGEPIENRSFNLPASLSKALNDLSIARGEDVTKVVHDAIRNELARGKHKVSDAVPPSLHEVVEKATQSALEKSMMREGVHIGMSDKARLRLEKIANKFGFLDVGDLLKSLATRALAAPDEAEVFLKQRVQIEVAARVKRRIEEESLPQKLSKAA